LEAERVDNFIFSVGQSETTEPWPAPSAKTYATLLAPSAEMKPCVTAEVRHPKVSPAPHRATTERRIPRVRAVGVV
jgi:hypothetical protein